MRKLIKTIGRDCVLWDWEKAFGGKSYGNRHLFRVNKIAKFLLEKEGGDEFVILVGAWVHDVSLVAGNDSDSIKVANETRKFLGKYKLDKKKEEEIVACAAGHETNGEELKLECAIVHDADALDKCGALGIIRHIWKTTNLIENRVLSGKDDFEKLKKHLLLRRSHMITKTASVLAEGLNKKAISFLENKNGEVFLMEEISTLAMEGKTTDVIVKILLSETANDWKELLATQIKCEYLK